MKDLKELEQRGKAMVETELFKRIELNHNPTECRRVEEVC